MPACVDPFARRRSDIDSGGSTKEGLYGLRMKRADSVMCFPGLMSDSSYLYFALRLSFLWRFGWLVPGYGSDGAHSEVMTRLAFPVRCSAIFW